MIYVKKFNFFLIFYLLSTGVFILYWMSQTIIDLGIDTVKNIWYLRGIGFSLIFGIIWEVFGIKSKEVKND